MKSYKVHAFSPLFDGRPLFVSPNLSLKWPTPIFNEWSLRQYDSDCLMIRELEIVLPVLPKRMNSKTFINGTF